jgi:hypothetical protein
MIDRALRHNGRTNIASRQVPALARLCPDKLSLSTTSGRGKRNDMRAVLCNFIFGKPKRYATGALTTPKRCDGNAMIRL